MPVMEGKAILFKEFGGVDAFPLCVATKDVDEIVAFCKAIAPTFGGINLEDISAPRCFEIEERLRTELDIPVFHDDQHGTAIVTLAALVNALQVVGKRIEDVKIVMTGVGAAGIATADILMHAGARNVIGADRGRRRLPRPARTSPRRRPRSQSGRTPTTCRALPTSCSPARTSSSGSRRPGAISRREASARWRRTRSCSRWRTRRPRSSRRRSRSTSTVVGTGRSDYPNQINNVLAFPGLFRGALDVRASAITEGMKVAASHALATVIPPAELGPEYVIPGVFNRDVAPRVAAAVAEAAERDGVARKARAA